MVCRKNLSCHVQTSSPTDFLATNQKIKKTTKQNRDGYFKYEIPISYLELEQKFV